MIPLAAAVSPLETLMGFAVLGLLLLIGAGLYLMPTIVAVIRQHHNAVAIAAVNVLAGWLFVGWLVALVWALTASPAYYRRHV